MNKRNTIAVLLVLLLLLQPTQVMAAEGPRQIEPPVPATDYVEQESLTEVPRHISPSALGPGADKALIPAGCLNLDGEALLLMELETGTLVYGKNIDQRREPASITKIMTCLLALERGDLSERITVTAEALAEMDPDGSTAGLKAGETYSLETLLYCLMVQSANDAALVIANYISGSHAAFAELMNERAEELGCTGTHFVNAHGLHDEDHYTTARDLARIYLAASEYSFFRTLTSTTSYVLPATDTREERTLRTTDYLTSTQITNQYYDSRVIGGKTGFTTPAGRCVICTAESEGLRYLVVVLGASSKDSAGKDYYGSFVTASKLLDVGFSRFRITEPLDVSQRFLLVSPEGEEVELWLEEALPVLLPKGCPKRLLTLGWDLDADGARQLNLCFRGICVGHGSLW